MGKGQDQTFYKKRGGGDNRQRGLPHYEGTSTTPNPTGYDSPKRRAEFSVTTHTAGWSKEGQTPKF